MWTGFYAGLNVGYAWGAQNNIGTVTGNVFDGIAFDGEAAGSALSQSGTGSAHSSGIVGGGQIGYNYQFSNNFVAGIEADLQGLGQRGHTTFANTGVQEVGDIDVPPDDLSNSIITSTKSVTWLGTLRGRLGWLINPTFLIYGDGGLAYGGVSGFTHIGSFWTPGGFDTAGDAWSGANGGFSGTRVGWSVGGGFEWMFMPNWTLKAEYLYYDLGTATWGLSPNQSFSTLTGAVDETNISASRTRFNGSIARVGLNYHFMWGVPPVVAKY
jgi:outer membrane immunogenic protein